MTWETGFATARKGPAKAADKITKDDKGILQLSAYPPACDAIGNVVAELSLDYPALEAAKFPE